MLRLSVPNEIAAIDTTRLDVLAFAEPDGLAQPVIYKLEVVIEEALMNRVMHAFPEGTRHETQFTFEILSESLVLNFEDDGIAFDPTQVDPPAPGNTLIGGLGLYLTRKAARSIRYQRTDGRNRVTVELARY